MQHRNTHRSHLALGTFAAAATLAAGTAQATTFTAVPTYDENAVATNTVDNSDTTYTVGQMQSDITAGFASGNSGVINFDTVGTPQNETQLVANFGAGKSLTVTRSIGGDGGNNYDFVNKGPTLGSTDRSAISGFTSPTTNVTTYGAIDNDGTDLDFNFGSFVGFNTDEVIKSVGVTILSTEIRNGDTRTGFAFVVYNDNSQSASELFNAANSPTGTARSNDSFVGFTAPVGLGIKQFVIRWDRNQPPINDSDFTSLDDLAFVTGPIGEVPEPATASLLGLLGLGLIARRRRRSVAMTSPCNPGPPTIPLDRQP